MPAIRKLQCNIQPWTGKCYGTGLCNQRILFLGESHYQNGPADQSTPDDTGYVIRRAMGKETEGRQNPFFTKLRRLVSGDDCEVTTFWESVAFYNYVQWLVPTSRRPTQEQWRDSFPYLIEILGELKPTRVLIIGLEMKSWLLSLSTDGRGLFQNGEELSFVVPRGNSIPALGIRHLQAKGFTYRGRNEVRAFLFGQTV